MPKYYAVRQGRSRGIFTDWPTTQLSVNGYSGAVFKSFPTYQQAKEWLEANNKGDSPLTMASHNEKVDKGDSPLNNGFS